MNDSNRIAGRMRQNWAKPELKRLNAGAAENGVNARGDSSRNPGTSLS